MSPEVIYEDKDVVVLNKPAGFLVHPIKNLKIKNTKLKVENEPTLTDWLLARYPEISKVGDNPEIRPGIVHRLDRATSGAMIVARTQESFLYLKSLFLGRKVCKKYLAWVYGVVKEKKGIIDSPIGIVNGTVKRSTRSSRAARDAITRYDVIKSITRDKETFSLLRVMPETGRTHQIRVHCASMGHPVVGDILYGKKRKYSGMVRMMLHAFSLELPLLSGSVVRFEADTPREFDDFGKR
ncbi:MAG: RluA family pseudouridine synthase [Patescibacteria group bacterium]|nr:RluA family pseudouridine synthase [Patescibacteria group bacterium]